MAYTQVTPNAADLNADGSVTVHLVYTGDANEDKRSILMTVRQGAALTVDAVRAEAIRQLAILNTSRVFAAFVKTILNQPIDVSPIADATPTVDDKAVNDLAAQVQQLRVLRGQVSFGLATADDVVAQVSAIGSAYTKATADQQVRMAPLFLGL